MNNSENKTITKESRSEAKKFAIDVSWAFSSILIGLIIGILFKLLLGNYFGPNGLGLYSMTIVLIAIVGIIGDFGVPAALVKLISQHKDNEEKVNKIVSCSLINAFLIGLILTFVFFILSEPIAYIFNMPDLAQMLKLVSIIFPFLLLNDIFTGIYNGYRWMNKYTYFILTRRGGLLIITWIFILIGWGIIAAIIALVLIEIILLVLNLIMLRNYKIHLQIKGHFSETKELFQFSKYLFLTFQIGYLNTNLDMYLIGYFLTSEHVGIYAIAVMIMRILSTIPDAISRIILPMTSELFEKKNYKKIGKVTNLIIKYSFIIVSIFALLIIFFGKVMLRIAFPTEPEFLNAYFPLILLIIGATFSTIGYSISMLFIAFGRPDINLKVAGITALLNFFLNISLIPPYGINGGALATSITLITSFILYYIILRKLKKVSINIQWLIISVPLFIFIIIIYFLLQTTINNVLLIIILFPCYVLTFYLGKIFTKKDYKYITGTLFKKK